jgi:hypothetical protein
LRPLGEINWLFTVAFGVVLISAGFIYQEGRGGERLSGRAGDGITATYITVRAKEKTGKSPDPPTQQQNT